MKYYEVYDGTGSFFFEHKDILDEQEMIDYAREKNGISNARLRLDDGDYAIKISKKQYEEAT